MKPEHDFPCEHCGPQVCEMAVQNTRYLNALEDLLLCVEESPEADAVGSDLYIAIKRAQIAIDPSLGWPTPSVAVGETENGECVQDCDALGIECPKRKVQHVEQGSRADRTASTSEGARAREAEGQASSSTGGESGPRERADQEQVQGVQHVSPRPSEPRCSTCGAPEADHAPLDKGRCLMRARELRTKEPLPCEIDPSCKKTGLHFHDVPRPNEAPLKLDLPPDWNGHHEPDDRGPEPVEAKASVVEIAPGGRRWFQVLDANGEEVARCVAWESAAFLAESLNDWDLTKHRTDSPLPAGFGKLQTILDMHGRNVTVDEILNEVRHRVVAGRKDAERLVRMTQAHGLYDAIERGADLDVVIAQHIASLPRTEPPLSGWFICRCRWRTRPIRSGRN